MGSRGGGKGTVRSRAVRQEGLNGEWWARGVAGGGKGLIESH